MSASARDERVLPYCQTSQATGTPLQPASRIEQPRMGACLADARQQEGEGIAHSSGLVWGTGDHQPNCAVACSLQASQQSVSLKAVSCKPLRAGLRAQHLELSQHPIAPCLHARQRAAPHESARALHDKVTGLFLHRSQTRRQQACQGSRAQARPAEQQHLARRWARHRQPEDRRQQ